MPGKHLTATLVAVAALQGCAFFTHSSSSLSTVDDNIKVGFVGSFSGTNAGNGNSVLNGVNMALEAINAHGVLGKHLEILQKDDQSDPATGAKVANELIDKGVVALIGPNSSGIGKQMLLNAAKPRQVAMISPSATSPDFSDPSKIDGGGYFFRTVPSDALQGKVLAARAKSLGYKKLAVVHVDNPYGDGLARVLESSFGEASATLDQAYPEMSHDAVVTYDWASLVKKAFDFNPDAVVMVSYPDDGSSIINEWIRSGRNPQLPWLFTDATDRQDFVGNVHDESYVEGKYGTAPATNPEFTKRFKAKFLADPGFDSGGGFDALCLIALAMQEAGEASAAGVQKHLRSVSGPDGLPITPDTIAQGLDALSAGKKVNYDGWEGTVDFDEHGDVTSGKYVIWKITKGIVGDSDETLTP